MRYCVDASAVLAKIIPDQTTDAVFEFWNTLTRDDELVAPSLVLAECTSVLRRKAYDGAIEVSQAQSILEDLLSLPIRLVDEREQFRLAFEIAGRTRRKNAYDMQYVAVALLEHCEMVTLDGGIHQASHEQRVGARFLR